MLHVCRNSTSNILGVNKKIFFFSLSVSILKCAHDLKVLQLTTIKHLLPYKFVIFMSWNSTFEVYFLAYFKIESTLRTKKLIDDTKAYWKFIMPQAKREEWGSENCRLQFPYRHKCF